MPRFNTAKYRISIMPNEGLKMGKQQYTFDDEELVLATVYIELMNAFVK